MSEWISIPLGEIAPATSNRMPNDEAEVWNLSLDEIEPVSGRIIGKATCRVRDLGSTKCSFDTRHVLYSKLRPYLNKVVLPDEPGVGTSELIPMLPDPKRLDREFLAYYLRSPIFLDFANANTRGANLPRIAMRELWLHEIPMPAKVDEQRRIVIRIKECTGRVEEIERLREDALAEGEHLAPSLYAALEDGEKWPRMAVGDVITKSRNGRSIRQDNENADGYVLSLSAVHDVTLDIDQRKPIILPSGIENQYSIKAGDVFVSRSNTRELVGLASVATEKPQSRVIYPDLLIKLESKLDVVLPRFLAYALRTPESRRQIKDRAVGTSQSMVKISGQRLKDVRIPVPPLNIQAKLIEEFDELHDLSADLLGNLNALNSTALTQSILRKAFAGEL